MRSLSITMTTLALTMAICPPAWAQPPVSDAQPTQPAAGDAGAAAPEPKSEALDAYKRGKQAFAAGRFEQALASFRLSYDKLPSPNSHLMIGKSLVELGRIVEAHQSLVLSEKIASEAAAGSDKYIDTLNAARDLLASVRGKIGRLRFSAVGGIDTLPPDASLRVGATVLARDDWDEALALEPGSFEVTLTTAEGDSTQTVEVTAGGDVTVALALPGVDEPPRPPQPTTTTEPEPSSWRADNQRTLAYVAGGVGVVGFALFGAFGGLTLSTLDDLESRCTNGACPSGSQGDIDSGTTYQMIANVGLIVGAVGVATGITLFVTDPSIIGDDGEETEARRDRLELSIGAGTLALRGRF
jgi:hypothetical protein